MRTTAVPDRFEDTGPTVQILDGPEWLMALQDSPSNRFHGLPLNQAPDVEWNPAEMPARPDPTVQTEVP